MSSSSQPTPHRVAVVGAGMVGLSTAWFLQEHGVEVTIFDKEGAFPRASWGNAGWLTPGIATPLPEPGVLAYGLRAVVSPSSPVYVPPTASPRLISFLMRFARNTTRARWKRAMSALAPINNLSLAAFDTLTGNGVTASTLEAAPFLAAFRRPADRMGLLEEIHHIRAVGQEIEFDDLTGSEARAIEPALSKEIGAAIRLRGQRFINPGAFAEALAQDVVRRGGRLLSDLAVVAVEPGSTGATVETADGDQRVFDAVVLATGTWLGNLARKFGVRTIVQAGRGYSFSVPIEQVPTGPVHFPSQRVACTPLGDRLRVAGMMEFRAADAPLDPRRIHAIGAASRPLLREANFEDRRDEWVGSRPCTPDGLPLIGATSSRRVFVAGGHGMWGVTLGPVTGQLLAEQIATGRRPEELRPFDPLR